MLFLHNGSTSTMLLRSTFSIFLETLVFLPIYSVVYLVFGGDHPSSWGLKPLGGLYLPFPSHQRCGWSRCLSVCPLLTVPPSSYLTTAK